MRYLIKRVSLNDQVVDIAIKDGKISEIGSNLQTEPKNSSDSSDVTVIDAVGSIALQGLVDLHTHLREPGKEDAETVESASRAAA
ncbi:MAG: dihydroorotase, partial [Candidatus Nanopelagicaceae bacterium]